MTIEISHDSAIMTYGLAKDPRRPWILGFITCLLVVLLVVLGLFVGLDQQLPQPAHTALLVSLIPSSVEEGLSTEKRASLPPLWREVLSGDSPWPVLLGAVATGEGWRTYAVFPRWRRDTMNRLEKLMGSGLKMQSRGLVVFVSDEGVELSSVGMRYPKEAHWWFERGWMAFHAIPEELFPSLSNPFKGSFKGYVKGHVWVTNIPVREPPPSVVLQKTDISLFISPSTNTSWQPWMRFVLPLGDRPEVFGGMPIQRLDASLQENGGVDGMTVQFASDLTKEQARQLLGSFGIVSKHVVQIGDGTLAIEQYLLDPSHDDTLFGIHRSPRFPYVEISPKMLRIGTSTHSLVAAPSVCGASHPVARLSSVAIQNVLKQLGIILSLDQLSAVQFFVDHEKLSACTEK